MADECAAGRTGLPDDDSWLPVVVSHLLPESGQAEWRADITQRHQVAAMSTDQDDEQRLSTAPDP
jgi:hypothetical protein